MGIQMMTHRVFRSGVTRLVALALSAVWLAPTSAGSQNAAATPTPRVNGVPDLSGVWAGTGGGGAIKPDEKGNIERLTPTTRPCAPGQECEPSINFERDSGVRQRMGTNVPMYKPEYWERVSYLDVNGNFEDPSFKCYPEGVPRMGAPDKIVQTPTEVILLYQSRNEFRVIPIDGRPHDPVRAIDTTLQGHGVGHWEGDTLVIEVVGFSSDSWIGWPGYFHTIDMKVTERLRRDGNTLTWQATVVDPAVLTQPWVMDPVVRRLNPNPKALLLEDLPCEERDGSHMKGTRERG
jgi:hypothetical protein